MGKMNERKTSQKTDDLKCRIQTNMQFGNANLTSWLIDKLNLAQNHKLLDVGCGNGEHLLALAKKFPTNLNITGVDISGKSIAQAKKLAQDMGLKIKFEELNMDDMHTFSNKEEYDIITSMYAIYYSANITKLLNSLYDLLKQDGKIVIVGPYWGNNDGWFKFINQFMELPEKVKKSTTDFMENPILLYAVHNFENVKCYKFTNQITIPSKEDLREYWKSNIYYSEELDPLFEKFAKIHFDNHDTFTYCKRALMIEMKTKSKFRIS